MKAVLLRPGGLPEVVELPDGHDYTDIMALLGIESPIDCVERTIRGKRFDLWVDDEGLWKDPKEITAICDNAVEILVGSVLVAKHDGEGNTVGLDEGEIDALLDGALYLCNRKIIENRHGDDVAFEDWNGFGEVKVNPEGAILRYGL